MYKILTDNIVEALASEGNGWYKFSVYIRKDGGDVFVDQPSLTQCLDKPEEDTTEDEPQTFWTCAHCQERNYMLIPQVDLAKYASKIALRKWQEYEQSLILDDAGRKMAGVDFVDFLMAGIQQEDK